MDPCTAAVISKMEDNLDLLGLLDFSTDTIVEIMSEIKESNNLELIAELHQDVYIVREAIEKTYEKKYGKKIEWKQNETRN